VFIELEDLQAVIEEGHSRGKSAMDRRWQQNGPREEREEAK
jgi:hypothetical protein